MKLPQHPVPALFIGSPIGLVGSGIAAYFVPAWLAFGGGALAAVAIGLGVLHALQQPASQRN